MTYVDRRHKTSTLIRRLYSIAVLMAMLTVAQVTAALVSSDSSVTYIVDCEALTTVP
jgi:hypothetical protein